MRHGLDPLRVVARRFLTDVQREQIWDLRRRLEAPLLKLRTRQATDLDALALLHGTDKSSWHHGYAQLYDRHLASRRTTVRRLLEIGVGGTNSWRGYDSTRGRQSLRMWSDYFPNAEIIGVDIYAKEIRGPRILFERGDQSDAAFLRTLIEKYHTFDVVIDDGSHMGSHVNASFAILWSAVAAGGLYVIEDVQTSYDPHYGGGPPGTSCTAAQLIKDAVDETLLRGGEAFSPSIAAMHVYGEIAFFEKARWKSVPGRAGRGLA